MSDQEHEEIQVLDIDPAEQQAADEARAEIEVEARKFGWRGKEEFDREPANWVDADRFMELPQTQVKMQRDEIKQLREEMAERDKTLDRIQATSRQAVESVRAQEQAKYQADLDAIQAKQLQAVEEGDTEAYKAAEEQRERLQQPSQQTGPDPVVADYRASNEWAQDPALWGEAAMAVNYMPNLGSVTPAEQLEFAEATMKRRYPHLFAAQEPAPKPAAPARVDSGGLGFGQPKKGFHNLPADAQKVAREMVEDGIFKSVEDYAKAYMEQN